MDVIGLGWDGGDFWWDDWFLDGNFGWVRVILLGFGDVYCWFGGVGYEKVWYWGVFFI